MQRDPDDHARQLPHLDVGVVRVLASLRRTAVALVACSLVLAGCAGPPEAVVADLELALRSGDRAAVEGLLTEESRGLLTTMLDAPRPESRWPLGLHAPTTPSHVVAVTPGPAGVVTIEVEDATGKSEWVVRLEAGRWRVDLIASSSRRAMWGM